MNIYGFRIAEADGKFPGLDVIPLGWDALLDEEMSLPCLVMFHPSPTSGEIDTLWQYRQSQIERGDMVVLVVASGEMSRPRNCHSEYFHCLSYPVYTPCNEGATRQKFERLVKAVSTLDAWREHALASILDLVEEDSIPDALVAWYVVLKARNAGIDLPDAVLPVGLKASASREFDKMNRSRLSFGLEGIKALLQSRGAQN